MNQLKDNGFKVDFQFPKSLIIDWKPTTNENLVYGDNNTEDTCVIDHYIPYKNQKGKFILNVD